jgi:hypothetical protein
MQFLHNSRAKVVCGVLASLLFASVAAIASNGREFSGYFDISDTQSQGDLVQVTLHLKLFNHGTGDAKSVIVTLVDPSPAMILRGSFRPLKVWKSQKFVEMSQQFTVTKREFGEWMAAPGQPNVVILYQDSAGQTWQKGAQLSRRPLVAVPLSD